MNTNESEVEVNAVDAVVNVGDTVICLIDEWRKGSKIAFDGHVVSKNGKGVDVIYLSGHRSRDDFVEWSDIIAKVDMAYPRVNLKEHGFSGHFQVFNESKAL